MHNDRNKLKIQMKSVSIADSDVMYRKEVSD